jgi:hypothetical protein
MTDEEKKAADEAAAKKKAEEEAEAAKKKAENEPTPKPGIPQTEADAIAKVSRRVSALESGEHTAGGASVGFIATIVTVTVFILGGIGLGIEWFLKHRSSP